MQRFRAGIYLADGAIHSSDLTADGRHHTPVDEDCWHVISLDPGGRVCACLRYLEESHASCFDDLWVRHAAAARSEMGAALRRAVEGEIALARRQGLGFGEVGGWAVDEKYRRTSEPLRIILAMYGLLELLGGCLGVATATWRHSSAAILRRIGLTTLEADGAELPPYFDSRYDCQMELLRFDSRLANPRYRESVYELAAGLKTAPLFCREATRPAFAGAFLGSEVPDAEMALA